MASLARCPARRALSGRHEALRTPGSFGFCYCITSRACAGRPVWTCPGDRQPSATSTAKLVFHFFGAKALSRPCQRTPQWAVPCQDPDNLRRASADSIGDRRLLKRISPGSSRLSPVSRREPPSGQLSSRSTRMRHTHEPREEAQVGLRASTRCGVPAAGIRRTIGYSAGA